MKTSIKFFVLSFVFGVASFSLSKVIWPDTGSLDVALSHTIWPESASVSVGTQLFLSQLISIIESVAFGVGMAFAILGWGYIKSLPTAERKSSFLSLLSITWLLISWWPHDNMHRVTPSSNVLGYIEIEYMFHVTLIIAGFILCYNFWKLIVKQN